MLHKEEKAHLFPRLPVKEVLQKITFNLFRSHIGPQLSHPLCHLINVCSDRLIIWTDYGGAVTLFWRTTERNAILKM